MNGMHVNLYWSLPRSVRHQPGLTQYTQISGYLNNQQFIMKTALRVKPFALRRSGVMISF
jgi:hypothetical protein